MVLNKTIKPTPRYADVIRKEYLDSYPSCSCTSMSSSLIISCFKSHPARRHSSVTIVSHSPSISISKSTCWQGFQRVSSGCKQIHEGKFTSREMYNCGVSGGKNPLTSETGATLRDVPITMTRSTRSLSCFVRRSWKVAGRSSPKKVISGFGYSQLTTWFIFQIEVDVPS